MSNGNDSVHPKIVDSVLVTNEMVLGDVVAESQGVTLESLAHSISLVMQNAQSTQYASQQVAGAAVASACAAILANAAGSAP